MKNRTTPEMVTELKENEVFVFGSNMQGKHIGGAARIAHDKFGAEWGVHNGLTGRTYAIPTVDLEGHMVIGEIREFIDQFTIFAEANPDQKFLVTAIGCGIAGYQVKEIAPMFNRGIDLNNVYLPKEFWDFYKRVGIEL